MDSGHDKNWLAFQEALYRHLPQRVFLKDCQSQYVFCNQTLAADYKITPEEITGRTDFDFFSVSLAEKYRADDQWVITHQQTLETEEEYALNGHKLWIRTLKIPVKDATGTVTGVLGMFWDITSEKHTKVALQISEEKLLAIIEQSSYAIILLHSNGKLIDLNQQASDILGVSRRGVQTLPASEIHPQLQAIYQQLGNKKGNPVREIVRKVGSKNRVFELRGSAITVAGETFYLVSGYDITSLKQAEADVLKLNEELERKVIQRTSELQQAIFQLSESEQRYRHMFLNNHVVMLIVNPDNGSIIDANPAAEMFYGYTHRQLVSMRISDINVLTREEIDQELARARSMERNCFEFRHRLANGEIKDVEVYSGPVVQNHQTMLFSVIHDITARKLIERALVVSDRRFRMLVEQAPIAIEIYDTNGYLIQINSACCQLFSITKPDTVVYSYNVLRDDIRLPRQYREAFSEALLGVPSVIGDTLKGFNLPNNERVFLHSYVYPLIDEKQHVRNIVFVHEDITLQKRVERMFKASLDLTLQYDHLGMEDFIVAALDAGVEITDSSIGFFHYINPDERTIRLQAWSTGTQKVCTVGEKNEHYPVDEAGVWVDCIRQRQAVIHNDYPSLGNKRGMPTGHVPLLREMVVPVFENEKIVCVFGVGNKDIPYTQFDVDLLTFHANTTWQAIQRRKAELALRSSEERYRMIIENMSDFIYSIRFNQPGTFGKFEWITGPIAEITGYGCEQLNAMAEGIRSIIVAEDLRKYKETIEYVREGNTGFVEHRILKNNGEIRWLRNYMKPVINAQTGTTERILGGVQDITERKLAEEQMIRLAAKQIVLLREVNHRVKNNLSALISMLHIEEDRAVAMGKPDLVPVLSNINTKLQGLLMVHSMLTASNWQPLVLTELAERLIRSLVSAGSEGNIDILCTGDTVTINSNQSHHMAIIINELVTNTIKYGLKGTAKPTIRVVVAQRKDMIHMEYSDNGRGFSNEVLESDFALTNIGISLISGIVSHSLEGLVHMYNRHGAVTEITFPVQTQKPQTIL